NKKESQAREFPIIKTVEINRDTTIVIFQISNFHHRAGGFFTTPKLGLKEDIYHERSMKMAFDLLLFGSILIMSFYHFGVYFMRRKKPASLFFGLFTLVLAVRTIFTGSQFIITVFPDISWSLKYRIEYLTLFLSAIFMSLFLYHIYKKDIGKRVTQIVVLISSLYTFSLIASPSFFTSILFTFQIFMLLAIVYYLYPLGLAVYRKRDGARILVTSIIIFFATIVNDIIFTSGVSSKTVELVPLGTFIFILGQSLVLAKIFNGAFGTNEILTKELDYQNRNLEKIVEKRTQQIEVQSQDIIAKNEELKQQNEEIQSINDNLEDQKLRLTESEGKFRGLVELLPEAIFELNSLGEIIYANDEFFNKLGFNLLDLQKNLSIYNLVYEQNENNELKKIKQIELLLAKNNVLKEREFLMSKKDKTTFPILLSVSAVLLSENTAYRCVFIDISRRVKNEQIIKDSYKLIRKKNEDITDSIRYALNIQNAVLPSGDVIASHFKDYFIINRPHSIVSGDFYYIKSIGDKIVFALSDCTGHGVPGGFMTMLGITQLNDIYNADDICSPSSALGVMRKKVIESLNQKMDEPGAKDGMDMMLCILDKKSLKLEFSGANQPLYIMRNGILIITKGDKMPIGIYRKMNDFTSHEIQLQKGDILYLFTDGIVDVFGGEKNKRLYTRGLQELIKKVHHEKLAEQEKLINEFLLNWQGDNKQTDDMLMLALRI
ncbi:MAG: hypothetical protein DRJ10_20185, partial [Bacteroidetes bacterium]